MVEAEILAANPRVGDASRPISLALLAVASPCVIGVADAIMEVWGPLVTYPHHRFKIFCRINVRYLSYFLPMTMSLP